jgi:hypothetical protein
MGCADNLKGRAEPKACLVNLDHVSNAEDFN